MNFGDEIYKQKFAEMYQEYHMVLRSIAYRSNIPKEEIEDIIHDTFLAYARSDYSMELPEEDRKKLLIRMLKNRCIDYHRSVKRHGLCSMDDAWYYRDEFFDADQGPEMVDKMIGNEKCRALLKEIDEMPKNWKEIVVLKMLEGRPTEEVCSILNISEKACYSRIARIRKYLDKLIKDDNWP